MNAAKIDALLTRRPEIARETRDCIFRPTDDCPEMWAELAAMSDDPSAENDDDDSDD